MALSELHKSKIRYHLGYLLVSFAASIQWGLPKPLQTEFMVEDAMANLTNPYAEAQVVSILETLDDIELKMKQATKTLIAERLGQMELHPLKSKGMLYTDSLEGERLRWALRLADCLGVPTYAYSARFKHSGPGSILRVTR